MANPIFKDFLGCIAGTLVLYLRSSVDLFLVLLRMFAKRGRVLSLLVLPQQVGTDGQKKFLVFNLRLKGNNKSSVEM